MRGLAQRRLDALTEAVLVLREGKVASASAGAERMLGVPAGELPGREVLALLPEEARRRLSLALATTGDAAPFRLELPRPADGSTRTVEGRLVCLPASSGCILTLRDISEARRAEELLARLAHMEVDPAEPQALWRQTSAVFEALGWGAILARVDGETVHLEHLVLPPGNPALVAFGLRMVGSSIPLERTPGIAAAIRAGRPVRVEDLPAVHAGTGPLLSALTDDLSRAGLVRSAVYPLRGEVVVERVLMLAGSDLTDWDFVALGLLADRLAASFRAEALRRELLRGARLAVTGGLAAELAESVEVSLDAMDVLTVALSPAPDDAGSLRLVEILTEESTRLHRLARDLRVFATPTVPVLTALALRPVVEDALRRVKAASAAPEASISVSVPEVEVLGDPELMGQALVNLLTNAFQHLPPGGRLRIGGEREVDTIRLRIYNDGDTIPREHVAHLFEPFFTTKASGTGLGLAIVRRIVEDLGGRIELDPNSTGVCFSIWLRTPPELPNRI